MAALDRPESNGIDERHITRLKVTTNIPVSEHPYNRMKWLHGLIEANKGLKIPGTEEDRTFQMATNNIINRTN